MIGGIVGGVIAVLVFAGLIAVFVARGRRRDSGQPNNDAALQSRDAGAASRPRLSIYAPFTPRPLENKYDVVPELPAQLYDAAPSAADIYTKPSPRPSEYEHGNLTKF
jgi:hypothetical protein